MTKEHRFVAWTRLLKGRSCKHASALDTIGTPLTVTSNIRIDLFSGHLEGTLLTSISGIKVVWKVASNRLVTSQGDPMHCSSKPMIVVDRIMLSAAIVPERDGALLP
jgi:hypothetical protein